MNHRVPTLVRYYPKPGKDADVEALLRRHWPTLNALDLVDDTSPRLWRGRDIQDGKTYLIELFSWKDATASELAHQAPEVMAIWERMGPFLDNLVITKVEALPVSGVNRRIRYSTR